MEIIKTYVCNDNRVRAYLADENGHRCISYPRILMEKKLGRPLDPKEQVHHKDGSPLNNNLENLEVLMLG